MILKIIWININLIYFIIYFNSFLREIYIYSRKNNEFEVNAMAVNFSGITDVVTATVNLMPSIVDLVVAIVPVIITMAIVSLITGIFGAIVALIRGGF